MEITLSPAADPLAPGPVAPAATIREAQAAAPDARPQHPEPEEPLAELRRRAAVENLEVRITRLPESDVTVYRIIDPRSGEVVREFPPEGLARALADLRRRAESRLDEKA